MITRPTLDNIDSSIRTEIETDTGISLNSLKNNLLKLLSRAFAGATYELYSFVSQFVRQFFPFWATGEYLTNWAFTFNVTRKLETFATGSVIFTGSEAATIPTGTLIKRIDGLQYETLEEGTITGGVATVTVEALTSGVDGNQDSGILELVNPVASIDPTATIEASGIIDGFDRETDGSLRERLLFKIQNPFAGGNEADFVGWIKEVSGVSKAWVYPYIHGVGSLGFSFIVDDIDPIPTDTKITEVRDHLLTKNPIYIHYLTGFKPVFKTIDLTLKISPNNSEVRTSIESSIDKYFLLVDQGSEIALSNLSEAISKASGELKNTIISPTDTVNLIFNEIPKRGVMTYQSY